MTVAYVDASALTKLVLDEPGSAADATLVCREPSGSFPVGSASSRREPVRLSGDTTPIQLH